MVVSLFPCPNPSVDLALSTICQKPKSRWEPPPVICVDDIVTFLHKNYLVAALLELTLNSAEPTPIKLLPLSSLKRKICLSDLKAGALA